MARSINRLSARGVEALAKPGRHADGGGLHLQIDTTGARRWFYFFQWQGRRKEMGLGSTRDVTLAAARDAAAEARQMVTRGVNPIDARRKAAEPARDNTFGAAATELMDDIASGFKSEKHRAQWRTTLETHAALIWGRPVAEIGTEDVLRVLRPIWSKTPETARRVRGRIERVLDAARARDLRSGENPARWRGHLAVLLPKQSGGERHHPAMAFDEIADFVDRLPSQPGKSPTALEFLILTAARTVEVLGARWDEIDVEKAMWTVPAERMKAGKEHRVPLSARALTLLADMPGDHEGLVFRGGGPGGGLSNMAMPMLLRRMKRRDVTVHGFRSTFRDWAGETSTFPPDVIEMALAHTIASKVERAYRRGDAFDKRRALMEAWADFCGRAPTANVVELRPRG